jgi:hypothetical protein
LWTYADSNAPIPAGSDAALVVWLKTIFIEEKLKDKEVRLCELSQVFPSPSCLILETQ